jgi:hypothetical protein
MVLKTVNKWEFFFCSVIMVNLDQLEEGPKGKNKN